MVQYLEAKKKYFKEEFFKGTFKYCKKYGYKGGGFFF